MSRMLRLSRSTQVTFPSGAVSGTSPVLAAVPLPEGRIGLVVEETPFHPVDHTWPDQPADRGSVEVAGRVLAVADCVTGAVEHDGGPLLLGEQIPVRRGTPGWYWLVVHVCEAAAQPVGSGSFDSVSFGEGSFGAGSFGEGDKAVLQVDRALREALSAGHTGCHLAALALNAALASRWRKEAACDALGHPDFDQTAISSSRILPGGSRDEYRLGKSLRKKGFGIEGLAEELPAIEAAANAVLRGWVAIDAPVRIDSPGPELTARRTWHCALPEGEASIPCGGTHVTGTGALGRAEVGLELSADGSALTMHTRVEPIPL